jgi:hypothetical protein
MGTKGEVRGLMGTKGEGIVQSKVMGFIASGAVVSYHC